MRSRIISLVFGVVTILVALSFQVITACSGIDGGHTSGAMTASIIGMAGEGHSLMVKTTIASLVISVVSILVLLMDRYLDRQAMKK